MHTLIILSAIVIIIAIALQVLNAPASGDLPYVKSQALFSAGERAFLEVLEKAVGQDYKVYGKVRIVDVAEVKNMVDRSAWQRAFNKVCAKHFDFVVCSKPALSVICAIELDDRSHFKNERKERDVFVSSVCKAIKLPFLQIAARSHYSESEIREKFLGAIGVQVGA